MFRYVYTYIYIYTDMPTIDITYVYIPIHRKGLTIIPHMYM